tara:strand:+ start:4609 stop:5946 length:1338 start_codon:yes stop_codon:yes gene_type:complete
MTKPWEKNWASNVKPWERNWNEPKDETVVRPVDKVFDDDVGRRDFLPVKVTGDKIVDPLELGGVVKDTRRMELATPQILVDMIKSGSLVGDIRKGYNPTAQDITKFALDFGVLGNLLGPQSLKRFRQTAPSSNMLKGKGAGHYESAGANVKPPRVDLEFGVEWLDELDKLNRIYDNEGGGPGLTDSLGAGLRNAASHDPERIDVRKLTTIRKQLSKPFRSASADSEERRIAHIIVDEFDDFVSKLKPEQAKKLGLARSEWKKFIKTSMIEAAIDRAKHQASGFQNGLQIEFRKLGNNTHKMKSFTKAEQKLIRKVDKPGGVTNLLKFIGKFGFNPETGTGVIGTLGGAAGLAGMAHSYGSPETAKMIATIAAQQLASNAARVASRKRTLQDAENLRAAVAHGRPLPKKAPVVTPRLLGPTVGTMVEDPFKNFSDRELRKFLEIGS